MFQKNPVIRTIYLYLFSLLGLIFLIIGAIRFIDMGLKAYVFTEAERGESYERMLYTPCDFKPEQLVKEEESLSEQLSEEEMIALKDWLAKYQEQEQIDYVKVRRHQDAATNLSFILVGLPLYLYHWHIIKKEKEVC